MNEQRLAFFELLMEPKKLIFYFFRCSKYPRQAAGDELLLPDSEALLGAAPGHKQQPREGIPHQGEQAGTNDPHKQSILIMNVCIALQGGVMMRERA